MQDLVSDCVTMLIVDFFEMIDIEHEGTEGAVDTARALEFELAELE